MFSLRRSNSQSIHYDLNGHFWETNSIFKSQRPHWHLGELGQKLLILTWMFITLITDAVIMLWWALKPDFIGTGIYLVPGEKRCTAQLKCYFLFPINTAVYLLLCKLTFIWYMETIKTWSIVMGAAFFQLFKECMIQIVRCTYTGGFTTGTLLVTRWCTEWKVPFSTFKVHGAVVAAVMPLQYILWDT